MLSLCRDANAHGSHVVPQVGSRPTMLLIGHQTFHPFSYRPTYRKLESLPLAERVAKLCDPEIRRRILSEQNEATDPRIAVVMHLIAHGLHKIFPLGDPPDYEPGPEKSVSAVAERQAELLEVTVVQQAQHRHVDVVVDQQLVVLGQPLTVQPSPQVVHARSRLEARPTQPDCAGWLLTV